MTAPQDPDPGVVAAIRHGFAHLLDFSGRDTRRQFWSYAAFLLLLAGTAGFLVYAPPMLRGYLCPSGASVTDDCADLPLRFSHSLAALCAIGLIHFLLVAAALVRRRHDRDWSEAAAALSPPVVALLLALYPPALLAIGNVLSVASVLYALIRGGAPERIAAALILASIAIYGVMVALFPAMDYRGFEPKSFAADALLFLALVLLAARANRFWPIWIVTFSGLGLLTHLAALITELPPWGYTMALALWSFPLLVTIVVATRAHRLRLELHGSDPAWSRRAAGRPRAPEPDETDGNTTSVTIAGPPPRKNPL